jgi:flagellin-specific chaperone FliS
MIQEYKQKHGKVDDTIKKDLQVFYNKDKGKQIEKEMISLLSLIVKV